MADLLINAPQGIVFKAMCDLTRHAKWAKHEIVITADQEGKPAVGHTYSSSEKGATPDRLTITETVPEERFTFSSFMSRGMGWGFDHSMTARPEGNGTMVTRTAKITKFPIFMLPMRLMIPLISGKADMSFLQGMKADLEGQ